MQKVFKLNNNGKIEFTKKELDNLLNEVYNSGYNDGKNQNHIWYSPHHFWWNDPYYSTITTTTTTTGNDISNNPYTIDSNSNLNTTTGTITLNNTK